MDALFNKAELPSSFLSSPFAKEVRKRFTPSLVESFVTANEAARELAAKKALKGVKDPSKVEDGVATSAGLASLINAAK
jgi:hypothetical protein